MSPRSRRNRMQNPRRQLPELDDADVAGPREPSDLAPEEKPGRWIPSSRSRGLVNSNRHVPAAPRRPASFGEAIEQRTEPDESRKAKQRKDAAELERRPASAKAKKPSAARQTRKEAREVERLVEPQPRTRARGAGRSR